MHKNLYESSEHSGESSKAWKECSHDEENIELVTDYGSGIRWFGKVCRKCNTITTNRYPYHLDEETEANEEIPAWALAIEEFDFDWEQC